MNRKKLQDFALIAEIVAGIAIVVTLAFLVVEMRSNTDAIRAQTYDGLMEQLNDWRAITATDDELADYVRKSRSEGWSSLTEMEQRQVWYWEIMPWGIYESAFYAHDRGTLGDDEWSRFQRVMCGRFSSLESWDLPENRDIFRALTPRFSNYIRSECE